MVLLIDNYDSFTHNLAHLIGALGHEVQIYRNDALTVQDIRALAPTHLVISPGPGRPENAGRTPEMIQKLTGELPIMGVCLGHQAIGQVFGGVVSHAPVLVHGKATPLFHQGRSLFSNLPNPFEVGRYHSLTVLHESLPAELEVLATSGDGQIMALRHRQFPVFGVQFHPESILTEHGDLIMQNFLQTNQEA